MIPGTRALAFAALWFDASTVSNVFEPLVADWQRQWVDSPRSRRPGVWISGALALTVSIAAATPKAMLAPWPAPGVRRRILTRVVLWTVALSMLLMTPYIRALGRTLDAWTSAYLILLLLPANIALVLPLASATIVDAIRSAAPITREERVAALRCGIALVVVMVLLNGWVLPAANHQYRYTAGRAARAIAGTGAIWRIGVPPPGLRELSVSKLVQDPSLRPQLWAEDQQSWRHAGAEVVLRELSARFSLALLPIVLMWARWQALRPPRRRWYSAAWPLVISAPLLFGSYMMLRSQDRAIADVFYLPRWSGPWLALTLLIAGAIVIDRVRRAGLKTRLYARAD